MPSLFSRLKTWVSLEKLTANDLNAEFDNVLNNLDADQIGGSSATLGNMQTTEDPGEVGSESLASSIEGELRRLRHMVGEITGETQWYESPDIDLKPTALSSSASDPDVTGIDVVVADTSGGAVDFEGFQNGVTSRILYILKNETSNSLTLSHNGTGTQKILTATGVDFVIPAAQTGGAVLEYDGTNWHILASSIPQDGTVTRGMQESVGLQSSASSGSFSTTSGTYVDVTNLSVTITTSGRPVKIQMQSDGNPSSIRAFSSGGIGINTVDLKLVRDATDIAIERAGDLFDTGVNFLVPTSSFSFIDAPSAGTYTYKMQVKSSSTGENSEVNNAILIAYEL